jgi:hypothetical protein
MAHPITLLSLLTSMLLASSCAAPSGSIDDPRQARGLARMSYAHTLEAELDAFGHVEPTSLRWADLDREQVHLSCVDGRAHNGVIGSPGGDAGELLLLLAAAEAEGWSVELDEIAGLIDAWVDEFGGFYLHTDVEALAELGRSLAADPRFHAELGAFQTADAALDVAALEAWLRSPPESLRDPLLAHLIDPEALGCGHLRAILRASSDYEVRPALAGAVISGFYSRLWSKPAQMRYVVLEGPHQERAILDVEVDLEHDPSLAHEIPLVRPANAHDQVFVIQPQAIAVIRRRAVALLVARHPELDAERLYARMDRLGADQLAATLRHLDVHLPTVRVIVDHDATRSVIAIHEPDSP